MPMTFDSSDPRQSSAVFDSTGHYRYWLTRTWDLGRPAVNFVMLNPSTADQFQLDPTVRRCLYFAIRWGFGTLIVTNLFAWRSTDPAALRRSSNPVGAENDQFLLRGADQSALRVAAWGMHGTLHRRDTAVMRLLRFYELTMLGLTKGGSPRHPLYVRADTRPEPYPGPVLK